MPGIYQNTVFQRSEAFGPLGSRYGDGHRPARHFRGALPVAQVDSVTIVDNSNGTTLNVVVDGITFFVADSSTAVAANFVAQINAHPTASQIVRATLSTSLILRLTARAPGVAFTATAGQDGVGSSTATRASVTANSAGTSLSPGLPMFRPAAGSSAGLCQLPSAVTDVFLGIIQFRHEDAELENPQTGFAYPPGTQVPVDPDGMHVVTAATAVAPGDPVYVALTTGALRSTGLTGQASRVTATAATNTVVYAITLTFNDTGESFLATYLSDGTATTTEIRDGLGDYINAHFGTLFTAVDVSTDAIDITGPAGRPFTVIESNSQLTVATQISAGSFLLPNARWESAAAAGNKALMSHYVP